MPLSGPDIQVNKAGGGAITLNGVAAGSSTGVGNVDFFVLQVSPFSGGVTWVNRYLNPGPVLVPMPYRNSGIDLANGVLDRSVAVGVFAQAWPTAHRLAQRSWAGPLPSLGDGHIRDPAQGTADD